MSDTGEGTTAVGPGDKVRTPREGIGTPEEEAVSDTEKGTTAEGPGNKVRTPQRGEGTQPEEEVVSNTEKDELRDRGTRYVQPREAIELEET